MAAPDPAPQLFKDSSCTGGGVHTCLVDFGDDGESVVEFGIAARLMAAHGAQIARVLEARNHRAQPCDEFVLIRRPDLLRQARH